MKKGNCFILVKCKECAQNLKISGSDIEWEHHSRMGRSMGKEDIWEGTTEIACDHCNNTIKITVYVSIYPQGKIEDIQINCEGGEIINENEIDKYKCLPQSIKDSIEGY